MKRSAGGQEEKKIYSQDFFKKYGQDDLRRKRIAKETESKTKFVFDPNSRLAHNLRLAVYNQIVPIVGSEEEAQRIEQTIYSSSQNTAIYRAKFAAWKKEQSSKSKSVQPDERKLLERLLLTHDELTANCYPVEQEEETSEMQVEVLCDRCKLPIESDAACKFHPGKRWKRPGKLSVLEYLCCGGGRNSDPCASSAKHVYSIAKLTAEQRKQLFTPYSLPSSPKLDSFSVYAMDCEMVYLESGASCLARVSIVDYFSEKTVVDVLVQPSAPVFDWNTKYSGITAEMFVSGDWIEGRQAHKSVWFDEQLPSVVQFSQMKELFCRYFTGQDIFIGHSLENDLIALHLTHTRVIDTAVLFMERASGRKFSLEMLTARYAKKFIQDSLASCKHGHDSTEDAVACISLVKYFLANELCAREATVPAVDKL